MARVEINDLEKSRTIDNEQWKQITGGLRRNNRGGLRLPAVQSETESEPGGRFAPSDSPDWQKRRRLNRRGQTGNPLL